MNYFLACSPIEASTVFICVINRHLRPLSPAVQVHIGELGFHVWCAGGLVGPLKSVSSSKSVLLLWETEAEGSVWDPGWVLIVQSGCIIPVTFLVYVRKIESLFQFHTRTSGRVSTGSGSCVWNRAHILYHAFTFWVVREPMWLSLVEMTEHIWLPARWLCVLSTSDREVEARHFSILWGHRQKHHRPTSLCNCRTLSGWVPKQAVFRMNAV